MTGALPITDLLLGRQPFCPPGRPLFPSAPSFDEHRNHVMPSSIIRGFDRMAGRFLSVVVSSLFGPGSLHREGVQVWIGPEGFYLGR